MFGLLLSSLLLAMLGAGNGETVTHYEIAGRVVLPSGEGASAATVLSKTSCTTIGLVNEAIADSDGNFRLKIHQHAGCEETELFASDEERYWMETGSGCFYPGPNGVVPTVHPETYRGEPISLQLGLRGGKITLQVRDTATGKFLYAGLHVERGDPSDLSKYCSMGTATGEDGSPHTLFLPPGDYVVSMKSFGCGSSTYFPAHPPRFPIVVREGQTISKVLDVGFAVLDTKSSYDNIDAKRCTNP